MNTNAISNVGASMDAASVYKKDIQGRQTNEAAQKTSFGKEAAAVFETSEKTETERLNIVEQMRSEANLRTEQFRKLVLQMFMKQGKIINTGEIWELLASGDFKVDPATAKKAADDISEDGYWGVKQTSERIFDFARALSGDDPEKMENMLSAFKKGFQQATGAWGKELPEISRQTYDAVLEKFEQFESESSA